MGSMAAGFCWSHALPRARAGAGPALQPAQPSFIPGHVAPPCWQHHVAAAPSKMPLLVPSPCLAEHSNYHLNWAGGWHRMDQEFPEMGSPWKIRKRGHETSAGFRHGLEKCGEGRCEIPVWQERSGTARRCWAGVCSAPTGIWPCTRAGFWLEEQRLTRAEGGGGSQG